MNTSLNNVEVNYIQTDDSLKLNNAKAETFSTDSSNYSVGDYNWYHNWYQPVYVREYPTYRFVEQEDKYKKAFAVAKMLLKQKVLSSNKLVDFIKLVEDITVLL